MNELILKEDLGQMVEQTKARVNAVQHIYREIMQEGKEGGGDYGIIPGCGKKPSLLKAGAEKLIMAFRLSAKISDVTEINLPGGHREYRVLTSLYAPDGSHIADGTGMCSSMESKYRYRGGLRESTGQPVPAEYWNLKKAGKIGEALAAIGGEGFGVMKDGPDWVICKHGEKMENPDPADQFNTILKMAKKRSLIDAVLTGTGASDIFTQDIEDMNIGAAAQPATGKPEVRQPEAKTPPPPPACCLKCGTEGPVNKAGMCDMCATVHPEAAPAAQTSDSQTAQAPKTMSAADRKKFGYISEAQEKRLCAIAKEHGLNDSEVKAEVWAKFNIEHCYQIPWKQYDAVIEHIKGFGNG